MGDTTPVRRSARRRALPFSHRTEQAARKSTPNRIKSCRDHHVGESTATTKRSASRRASSVLLSSESPWRPLINRIKGQISRYSYCNHLVNAYTSEGWRGGQAEKVKPLDDVRRAYADIVQAKQTIKAAVTEIENAARDDGKLPAEPSIDDDDDSGIDEADIVCCKCHGGDSSDRNDILLCDHGPCGRAYHQLCQNPPVTGEEIGDEDADWFCRRCQALLYTLALINDAFDTDFDSSASMFPELQVYGMQRLQGTLGSKAAATPSKAPPTPVQGSLLAMEFNSDSESDDSFDPEAEAREQMNLAPMSATSDDGETSSEPESSQSRSTAIVDAEDEEQGLIDAAEVVAASSSGAQKRKRPLRVAARLAQQQWSAAQTSALEAPETAMSPSMREIATVHEEENDLIAAVRCGVSRSRRGRNRPAINYSLLSSIMFGDTEDTDVQSPSAYTPRANSGTDSPAC